MAVEQDLFHPNPVGFDGLHVRIDENPSRPLVGAYPAEGCRRKRRHDKLPLQYPIVIGQHRNVSLTARRVREAQTLDSSGFSQPQNQRECQAPNRL